MIKDRTTRCFSAFLIAALALPSCLPAASSTDALPLVPWPRSVEVPGGVFAIGLGGRIVPGDPSLRPHAEVLAAEIEAVTGLRLTVGDAPTRAGDVALRILPGLAGEDHRVRVDGDRATVEGGSPSSVSLGTATLLQLIEGGGGKASIPRVAIDDGPAFAYRGLLIDVARRHHPLEVLEGCVRLCRLYKIRYLQLHLTDDQAFTFPSTAYPLLSARTDHGGPAYTLDELRRLERFAADRGVAIVPELEVPGHGAAMNRAMPDLFLIKGTKPYEHHASINFASPRVIEAIDRIVGEMCDVFRTSPYFHIGGDEADLEFAHQNPDFQAAFREYRLGEKGQHELYRRFLIQMDEIVKRRGKKMLVWEGFGSEPRSRFPIPLDVTVMEYECPFYPPELLVRDGRTFINAAWTPLYIVNDHRWSPEKIHGWNPGLLGQVGTNWSTIAWHRVDPTPLLIGAQMCAWEQPAWRELSSLRTRLPAMAERIWCAGPARPWPDFARRAAAADRLLSKLAPSVAIEAAGLVDPSPDALDLPTFSDPIRVTLRAETPGAAGIRYTLDGGDPTGGSGRAYDGPIVIDRTVTLRAAALEGAGRRLGLEMGEVFSFRPRREPNLASGKPVTASAGTQWPQKPEFAVDGRVDEPHDSWWAGPAPQWLRVDLQEVFRVDRIRIFPYWDGSRSYRYTVEVSEDGEAWKTVVDRRENTAAARTEGDDFRFPVERVRHVRVNMLGNTANEGVHLVEVEVFEAKGR